MSVKKIVANIVLLFILLSLNPVFAEEYSVEYIFPTVQNNYIFFVKSEQRLLFGEYNTVLYFYNRTYIVSSPNLSISINRTYIPINTTNGSIYLENGVINGRSASFTFGNIENVVCKFFGNEFFASRFTPTILPFGTSVNGNDIENLDVTYECGDNRITVLIMTSQNNIEEFNKFLISILEANTILFGKTIELFNETKLIEKSIDIVRYNVETNNATVNVKLKFQLMGDKITFEDNLILSDKNVVVNISKYNNNLYTVVFSKRVYVTNDTKNAKVHFIGRDYFVDVPIWDYNFSAYDISSILTSAVLVDYKYVATPGKNTFPALILKFEVEPIDGLKSVVTGVLNYHNIAFSTSDGKLSFEVPIRKDSNLLNDNRVLGIEIPVMYNISYEEKTDEVTFYISGIFVDKISPDPKIVSVSEDKKTLILTFLRNTTGPTVIILGNNSYRFEAPEGDGMTYANTSKNARETENNLTVKSNNSETSHTGYFTSTINYLYLVLPLALVITVVVIVVKRRKPYHLKWFERNAPNYDVVKTKKKGKYTLVFAIDSETGEAYVFVFKGNRLVKKRRYGS